MPNLDSGELAERLRALGGQSETVFFCLFVVLVYISKGWVAEFSRKHREKAQRRRKNAKKGAFEWDTIKREVDDVRILIRALQASQIRSSPVMAEEARAAECLELKSVRDEVERRFGLENGDLSSFRKEIIQEIGEAVSSWPENHFEYEDDGEDSINGDGNGNGSERDQRTNEKKD